MANEFCEVRGSKVRINLHPGQTPAWECQRNIVAVCAGSQSGKTIFGPWWLNREIDATSGGDHLVVTATYDLFKLKLLPTVLEVFEHILGIGRFWGGDRILELREPGGKFWAKHATDRMWARVILRSAESLGGLESATARSAWLDEAGQDSFTLEAWRAIKRRLALYRGRCLITTTLYNLGWLVQQIVERAENGGLVKILHANGGEVTVTDNAAADIGLVQFDSIVNPVYPHEEYEAAQATLPDDEFWMFYRGRRTSLRGLVYDVFDRRLHTCPRFELPAEGARYLGLDFGGVNTAGIYFWEEPKTRKLYGYREYLGGGRTAKEHVGQLLNGEPGRPVCFGGSHSEQQWRQEFGAAGLPVRESPVTDVWIGIRQVYGLLKSGQLVFFDDLHGLLDQLGSYRRKRDRQGELTQEIENKDSYHFLDAVRYPLSAIRADRPKMRVLSVETAL